MEVLDVSLPNFEFEVLRQRPRDYSLVCHFTEEGLQFDFCNVGEDF